MFPLFTPEQVIKQENQKKLEHILGMKIGKQR